MNKIVLITILILICGTLNTYALNIHREKSSTYAEETNKDTLKKLNDKDNDFKNLPIAPIINTNSNIGNIPLFIPGAAISLPASK